MQRFSWKLPFWRRLSPMRRGALRAGAIAVCTFAGVLTISYAIHPSAEFGQLPAQIGAAFLIAYGVEISWIVRASSARNAYYETWIGFVTGLGFLGLTGVGAAVVLADSQAPASAGRDVLACWAIASIAILGGLVAAVPALSYEWRRQMVGELDDE